MVRPNMLATRTTAVFHKRPSCSNIPRHTHSYSIPSSQSFSKRTHKPSKSYKTNKFLVFCNTQITKFGREGNINEAKSVFDRMPCKNVISWTAMLTAYANNGEIESARKVFDEMHERNIASYNAMITAYIRGNARIDEASELFATMPERNPVSYAAMITGFVRAGMLDKAEKLYLEVPLSWRDPVCSNALLSGYLKVGRLDEAVIVFDSMVEKNVVSWCCIVDGYCKGGRIVEARELFDKMPERNVVCWTAMINGYMKCECFEDGFEMFLNMRREGIVEVESTTLTIMFEACGSFRRCKEGVQTHKLVLCLGLEHDVFLGNSVITMYSRFGCVNEASKVFHMMSMKDVVSWNSLIAGYVQNDEIKEAYRLFVKMPRKDVVSWTTMMTGFFSKGMVEKSIELFEKMPNKDDVAWTAVISGFLENGLYDEAIRCFIEMLRKSSRPNSVTLSSVLGASAGSATLSEGLQIHAYVLKFNIEHDLSIQNSLVSMYSKCGNVADAHQVFLTISEPNIVSFNSMITGFAQNGFGEKALALFKNMQDKEQSPNDITFLAVLSACSHVGLVEEGWNYFNSMKSLYNMEPGPDHFACMVDLLGRAGQLDEANSLIHSMSCDAHAGVWGALLGASKNHSRLDIAKLAAEELFKLEPGNVTPYVVLSTMYSVAGKRKDEEVVRRTKRSKRLSKSPGSSWIIVNENVS